MEAGSKPPAAGGSSQSEPAGDKKTTGSNVWDFLSSWFRELIAVGALVFLTVFLADKYDDVKDVAAILGIVVPVLGAAVGATLGYAGGEAKGKADKDQAVKDGRRRLAESLKPAISEARRNAGGIRNQLETALPSPEGRRAFMLRSGDQLVQPIELEAATLTESTSSLDEALAVIDSVVKE